MDSSGVVTSLSYDGTDTVIARELSDLVSATMQAKTVATALSPGEQHNIITDPHLQQLTQRHRNTAGHSVSCVTAVDAHNVVPYSQCYGCAPRSFVIDVHAAGIPFRKAVASGCEPFTGKS